MKLLASISALLAVHATASAIPSQDRPSAQQLEDRQLVGGLVGGVLGTVDKTVSGLLGSLDHAIKNGDRDGVLDILRKLKPARKITSVEEATAVMKKIADAKPKNVLEYQALLVANGLIEGTVEDLFAFVKGYASGKSGHDNENPDPPKSVYPRVADCDAPYSVSEADLRSAIYIPESFTYGKKQPVILMPGTGTTGYISFQGNFIPLLTDVDWADPVWVNVPGNLLGDVQGNAEYTAYALNYIASLAKRDVAIVAWSQGNIDTQWALKYWPSTRKVTTDHIAISADYKGTILADPLVLAQVANDPSIVQQRSASELIRALRSDGGDSGYVPTTSVYSGFIDEVVQPQSGTGASAYLLDARNVGVTNNEVQVVCKGQPGGSIYTHESMMASSLAFALAKDALTHDGPGKVERLNLDKVCSTYLAPGLGLGDLLVTENTLTYAALAIVAFPVRTNQEPAIKSYATSAVCPKA